MLLQLLFVLLVYMFFFVIALLRSFVYCVILQYVSLPLNHRGVFKCVFSRALFAYFRSVQLACQARTLLVVRALWKSLLPQVKLNSFVVLSNHTDSLCHWHTIGLIYYKVLRQHTAAV